MGGSYIYATFLAFLLHLARGRQYVGVSRSLNWSDAESYCLDTFGTHLATITSDNENRDVRSAGTEAGIATSSRLWFGFNDLDVEGTWKWTDGTNANYTNWSPNNPNNFGSGQHCSSMYPLTSAQSSYNTTWDDNFCYSGYPFVCNKDMVTTTTMGTSMYICVFCDVTKFKHF